jgi:tRNA(fMet)-specific endonuclease VapC
MDTAATLLTALEDKGTLIAYGDLFVAVTALTHDLILVTNNTKHFSKVEGLVLENWMKP